MVPFITHYLGPLQIYFHIAIPTRVQQGELGMIYAASSTRSSHAVLEHSRRAPGRPEAAELTAGRCSITPEPTFPSVIHELVACSKKRKVAFVFFAWAPQPNATAER